MAVVDCYTNVSCWDISSLKTWVFGEHKVTV
uniref:Uncharacterized protein n=1 Tax=Arundo donax TaxID=35708 RepID=A0A0A9C866_ARUDO